MLMDLDILKRLIGLVRLSILNRMHNPQPCNRPPKNRGLLIQPRRSRRRDKINWHPSDPGPALAIVAGYRASDRH